MKTAMQELLETLKEYRDLETSTIAISRLNSVYVDILGMLEKEKEQIRKVLLAYNEERNQSTDGAQGYCEPSEVDEFLENYYETFNTK